MAILTINISDIGISRQVWRGVENIISTKTSANSIRIDGHRSTSSNAVYAFHPILNAFVEIDPSQAWFWSSKWLPEELKAEHELQTGDFEEFDTMDDLIDSL